MLDPACRRLRTSPANQSSSLSHEGSNPTVQYSARTFVLFARFMAAGEAMPPSQRWCQQIC